MGLFGGCSNDSGNNLWIWILIAVIIIVCSDGNIFGSNNNCCCEKPRVPKCPPPCEPECC